MICKMQLVFTKTMELSLAKNAMQVTVINLDWPSLLHAQARNHAQLFMVWFACIVYLLKVTQS